MGYTQSAVIQSNGSIRINGLGPSPYAPDGKQVGYNAEPSTGLLIVKPNITSQLEIADCVVNVIGYDGSIIEGAELPNEIYTEFPCSVEVVGPPGTSLVFEAWPCCNGFARGAKKTFQGDGVIEGIIPPWATTWDAYSNASFNTIFYSDEYITPIVTNLGTTAFTAADIPGKAKYFRTSNTANLKVVMFRQR